MEKKNFTKAVDFKEAGSAYLLPNWFSYNCYQVLRGQVLDFNECRIKSEYLDSLGIAQGNLVFSSYKKANKKAAKKVKRYTNVYIMRDHKKEYVSKKNSSYEQLLEMYQMAVRTEIADLKKVHLKAAHIFCNLYNALKPSKDDCIELDDFIESEYETYKVSVQYEKAISDVNIKLAQASEAALEGRTDFRNDIYLNSHERYRSKNELIAACALKAAGISYEIEPQYPGVSRCKADFGLTVNGRKIYIEIAGMMSDEKYNNDILEKRRLAKQNNLPFVIIDMTDYKDETDKNRTRLHFSILKHIFLNICLGRIKCNGEILKPYISSGSPPLAVKRNA